MEMNNGLNIDISRPAPLYLQVKQNILQLIDRGELKDGDRLPPSYLACHPVSDRLSIAIYSLLYAAI
ncbi:MAG: hypothetical protein ACOX1G_00025 [bacterium]|jgi:hypothetical protein